MRIQKNKKRRENKMWNEIKKIKGEKIKFEGKNINYSL